ncbi:MAG: tetratricopeptide repeat protein [Bacteroidota bacterium]
MGSINLELGDFEKAEEIYETLIGTLSKSKTSNELLARALNDLGKIKLLTNRRSESLKLFLEAEKLKKEIGDPNLMLTTINNLGDFYAGERDYEKALDYLLEPLIDQDEKVNVDELHVTFTHVIEIYKNQGKPEIALDYSDELIKLLEVKSGKIEWLNEQYDKKEVEVAKLKYENSKLERENAEEKYQNLRLWFIVAIAGFSLIIVGVIMWFIRKDRNEYKELSEELKQQVLPKWQMGNWYRK